MAASGSASSGAARPGWNEHSTGGLVPPQAGSDIGDDPRPRHLLVWHTGARIFEVVSGTGRTRFLLVIRCPHCADSHAMSVRELRPTIRRKAPCALGVVVIHTHADEVAA